MLLNKIQHDVENGNIEFLLERPIGWSSACLDSTISYYLSCNNDSIHSIQERDNMELKKEKI